MSRAPTTHPGAQPTFRLRPFTGTLELAMAEATSGDLPRALAVTRILVAALSRIDEKPVDEALARSLATGSRDGLLLRIAASMRPGPQWFDARCQSCHAPYDFSIDLSALPFSEAGSGFPQTTVQTSLGLRRFEAPNGTHEEAIATAPLGRNPARQLIALCGLDDDAEEAAQRFTAQDLATIDSALDRLMPQATEMLESRCPECGMTTHARIEPLGFAFPKLSDVLHQTHRIARAYHWSERDILALPSARRRRYLEMIGAEQRHLAAPAGLAGGWQ
jgi:hypothetical protein